MKLDTIPTLIKELEGYRQQLTTNYLNDKEVTDKLAREVFDRQSKDLKISHILFSLNNSATPADTLKAYQSAMDAYREIMKTKEWDALVKKYSNDINTTSQSGSLGWITAMLPDGFFHFEKHNLQFEERRNFLPGQIAIGIPHLSDWMIRDRLEEKWKLHIFYLEKVLKVKADILAQGRADSTYQILKKVLKSWPVWLVKIKTTSMIGGNIGYFGINQYETGFGRCCLRFTTRWSIYNACRNQHRMAYHQEIKKKKRSCL
ncbi:MAG: peptidylprolyl isomerase [Saprospiraceae bacterium]|nr:peptidylprolyl isomerase [Saprospiraceae bacterium]